MKKPRTGSLPRARRTKSNEFRERNDARLKQIVDMMARGAWFAGSSHVELAAEWDSNVEVVKKVAATASKVLRMLVQLDPDEMRAQMFCALEDNRKRAIEKTRTLISKDGECATFDEPDLKAANQSIAVQAQILGLVTTKIEGKLSVERERFERLTPTEKLEEALRVRAELDAEIASLRKQLKGAA